MQLTPEDEAFMTQRLNSPELLAEAAQKEFVRSAKAAAQEIVAIAQHGSNDRVRLDAAKYIIDRALGRIGEAKPAATENDPYADVFGAVIREPTAEERALGMQPKR